MILFLHGAGEGGCDGFVQTKVGIGSAIAKDPARFPAIVVFPQSARGEPWRDRSALRALRALDEAIDEFHGDRDRVSLTGISMGGYGSWGLALREPDRFACIVPICGGLDTFTAYTLLRVTGGEIYTAAAERLAHIPAWLFHGDADTIIPVTESRVMVDVLRAAGGDPRYTEYPLVTHNSWDRAYREPELVPWMLAQCRAERRRG